jgi:hypothetical protein
VDVPAGTCGNYHLVTIPLGPAWETHEIHWSELLQDPSWFNPAYRIAPFDPTRLMSVEIHFGTGDADLWLDDLTFLTH